MMKENLIFVHIPKNGGSSLDAILDRHYPREAKFNVKVVDKDKLNLDELKDMPVQQREKIRLVKGHSPFGLHQHLVGDTKYVTFLRKPEERVVSFYYFVKRRPQNRLYDRIVKGNMSLYDFVTTIDQQDVNNAQIRWISGIHSDEETMLKVALENIEKHFACVGLVERFDESLILLKNACGFGLPHYKVMNRTEGRPKLMDLDDKTRSALSELNKGDNKLYEIMEKRVSDLIERTPSMKWDLLRLKVYNRVKYNSLFGS